MIFVTIGTQVAFDRLINAVDGWARANPDQRVFAQIGPDGRIPEHVEWVRFLEPDEFTNHVLECDAIVAHAGMGSILLALQHGKPILVMPRKGALMEHRNDHQIDTAREFAATGQVLVAMDETEIPVQMDALIHARAAERISSHASSSLLAAVRGFIHGEEEDN